tara:strand:+ start:281 stop:475 length:195 start_codon:yes stop_codon:yes gene_type:complete
VNNLLNQQALFQRRGKSDVNAVVLEERNMGMLGVIWSISRHFWKKEIALHTVLAMESGSGEPIA